MEHGFHDLGIPERLFRSGANTARTCSGAILAPLTGQELQASAVAKSVSSRRARRWRANPKEWSAKGASAMFDQTTISIPVSTTQRSAEWEVGPRVNVEGCRAAGPCPAGGPIRERRGERRDPPWSVLGRITKVRNHRLDNLQARLV